MVTVGSTFEQDEKVSVPGFTEEELAHLSNGQRRKLAAERGAGKLASDSYQKAFEHNRQQIEKVKAEQEAANGTQKLLDPNTITAQRIAEHKLSEARAREQQAINAAANAAKEAHDQNEASIGREAMHSIAAEKLTSAAVDVVMQRVEQAEAIGLTAGQATHGHPANSSVQAEATMANTQKELADRVQAGMSHEALQGNGTGDTTVTRVPVFDSNGEFMGTRVGDVFERDPEYSGDEKPQVPETYEPNTDPNVGVRNTENNQSANPAPVASLHNPESPAQNGQSMQTNEPDAAALAAGLGTDEDDASKSRRRNVKKPATTNTTAIGTGPKSE